MRCLMTRLIPLCAILSLGSCTVLERMRGTTTDSYCQVYEPVVQAKGEGAIIAAPPVKRRILTNEQTYRTLCPKDAE